MTATTAEHRPAVVIESLFDDTSIVDRILQRLSPHPTTLAGAEFVETRRQLEAAAQADGPKPGWLHVDEHGRPILAGVFRTTWADGDIVAEEADTIASHPTLIDAARRLYGAEIVRPYFVYVNISTPKRRDVTHTDITAFRGVDRHDTSTWLINSMNRSALFGRWQIKIATGVAWYYNGVGGGFTYWPDGIDGEAVPHDAAFNSCIVGDNDHMPHRVEQIGDGAEPLFGFDAKITLADDRWVIDDDGVITDLDRDEIRVSLSWKAQVFDDAAEAQLFDDHRDDLDLATVAAIFERDLTNRGVAAEGSDLDAELGEVVRATYLPMGV